MFSNIEMLLTAVVTFIASTTASELSLINAWQHNTKLFNVPFSLLSSLKLNISCSRFLIQTHKTCPQLVRSWDYGIREVLECDRRCRQNRHHSFSSKALRVKRFKKMSLSQPLYILPFTFKCTIGRETFADVRDRTADLWCWKRQDEPTEPQPLPLGCKRFK